MLPGAIVVPLRQHLARLHHWYLRERKESAPGVSLPPALRRKYPAAPLSWPWQYVFPSATVCADPYGSGPVRHHLHSQTVQKLLGHTDVRATMIYTHVLNRGGLSVRSPLDASSQARPPDE